jgi:hypothetical protein
MLRQIVLASMAAATLSVGVAGLSTTAFAGHWDGPRHGYGGGYGGGHGYGPPPWVVRRWQERRHHFGPPSYDGPRRGHCYGRPVPRHPHW